MGKKGGIFHYADNVDKVLMFLGVLGSIGDGLMSPLTMLILSQVIDEYGTSNGTIQNNVVDKYAIKLLCLSFGIGASAFVEGMCWTRTAERQTSRIRMEYLRSILRQEVGFFDQQSASSTTFQVVTTISSDAHSIQDAIAEKIPNCLTHLSAFIFGLLVAFLLSWRLAVAALPFSIGFVFPGVRFGRHLMNLGMKMKEEYSIPGGIAEQAISSVRTVYSYVGEKYSVNRFSSTLQTSMDLGIKQGTAKGLMIGSMGMVSVAWAFQSWVGSILVTEKGESGGRVFVAAICIVLGGLSCMSALPNISFISEAIAAGTRIFTMIDRVPEIDSTNQKGKKLSHVRGVIEFRDVYFHYPSRPDTPVLQGFCLKVKAGITIGLVGGSGCGKSTVISLLERFYDPVRGDVLLDGYRIKSLKLEWLRSQLALVNQEPVLFATSIKENILFGKEGSSIDLVMTAARAANAHNFICELPDGYETQVGQFGVQLSGGQKQRIAIARALLKDPKILLLDEATSALDAQSESVVQEALDKASQGRTTIIIAHRLTTIRNADKIAVVQSGIVIESGSHDELMQRNDGAYSKMVNLQQSTSGNEVPISPFRKEHRALNPTPQFSVRSSWQNSPASPFSAALCFEPSIQMYSYYDSDDEDLQSSSHQSPSQLRILKMNAPEWRRAFLGCIGAVSFGAVQPIQAYCLGSIVSVFFLEDHSKLKSETRRYCIIFVAVGIIIFFSNLLQHHNFAVMGERLTKRIREMMFQNLLSFEIGWFDQDENTNAAICSRLAAEANMVRSLVGDRMSLLVQVFTSAALAFVLGLIVTWRVAIVMIAIQPLLIACFYSRSVLLKRMSEKAKKAQNEGSQLASEAVVNHRTITAFSSQDRILNLYAATLKGPKKQSIKQSWVSSLALFSSQFVTTASITLTYWYGGRLMNEHLVSSKHLFQVFFILMSTGKSIADAGSMSSDLARGNNAVKSVFAILDRKTKIDPEDPKGREVEEPLRGKIELKNVFFAYPARPEQMIIQGLNLKIDSGKTMALVGQSGSGKSTIIGLIERFYDPINGSVLIDNIDIKIYNLRSLRSHIALVSQEPTLFGGTILENICFGNEDATESEIKSASKLANAHEFISAMKDGYKTYCGERGVQLSGGQKQRIALARAILKNPTILLLDEATSALDNVSESLVQEALEKLMKGRTCVIVAHRLSTIKKADSIAVIKNGKVVEQGSHSELLNIGHQGSYYSLIRLQHGHSP
ncbi:ATP-binding cassette [Lithospermum erythrorhizon]|uniref:ATP-binding cassette n=1 Tax=Lithospermum erythrorhizon TaxID=34254 RepID=A0AAV3RZ75_LITER